MSTVQVTKIDFESTSNNRISHSSNTLTFGVEGSNTITINSSAITISGNVTSSSISLLTSAGSIVANTLTISSNGYIDIQGQFIVGGNVTPTAINANTSDFAPPVANTTIVRLSANSSNNSDLSIYGMTGGVNGQIVILSNIGTKVITLENESPNNSNTVNRFSLPQNIPLNGYQSISMYYDGNSLRWKTTDTNYISFYKNLLNKGFVGGGWSSPASPFGPVTTVDRTTFSTETTAVVPGSVLSQARYRLSGAGNACKGFYAGGTAVAPVNTTTTADRTLYSAETTAAAPGAALSIAKSSTGSAGNSCKSFFSGGVTPVAPGISVVADRITYATESRTAVTGANLTQARTALAAAGNACKGFFSGGSNPSPSISSIATACRTTYATETTAAVPGANLTQARYLLASSGNACKGIFIGGQNPGVQATACRTTFATEITAAIPGANYTQAKFDTSGVGNACKGFFGGGYLPTAPNFISTTQRTIYSTETTASVPTTLSAVRAGFAATH